ncbi:hypothetical protein SAMN04488057_113115 [Cyclobacterium lianum]|uniref:Uncharacterized protein n=1 Tax=Cyclobacterium lianum TaxID=388280 RepID=A0A1M7Q3X0_9BACT|nr:hypothetical protein SAMN04488057_113115 [Cyclobacterium lianum]
MDNNMYNICYIALVLTGWIGIDFATACIYFNPNITFSAGHSSIICPLLVHFLICRNFRFERKKILRKQHTA